MIVINAHASAVVRAISNMAGTTCRSTPAASRCARKSNVAMLVQGTCIATKEML